MRCYSRTNAGVFEVVHWMSGDKAAVLTLLEGDDVPHHVDDDGALIIDLTPPITVTVGNWLWRDEDGNFGVVEPAIFAMNFVPIDDEDDQ